MPRKKKPVPRKDPVPVNPWPAKLRALRAKLGIAAGRAKPFTQVQLAALLGITQGQCSRLEDGTRIPSGAVARLIDLHLAGKIVE